MAKPAKERNASGRPGSTSESKVASRGENKFSARGLADKIRARQSRNARSYNQYGN